MSWQTDLRAAAAAVGVGDELLMRLAEHGDYRRGLTDGVRCRYCPTYVVYREHVSTLDAAPIEERPAGEDGYIVVAGPVYDVVNEPGRRHDFSQRGIPLYVDHRDRCPLRRRG